MNACSEDLRSDDSASYRTAVSWNSVYTHRFNHFDLCCRQELRANADRQPVASE